MPVRRLAAFTVLALLLAGATATAAGAAGERRCGDAGSAPDAPQDVRATGVSCSHARSLARAHSRQNLRGQHCDLAKASCRLQGYTCTRTFFGDSGTRVRCSDGPRRVRFFYGV